jgi:formylglycine-generating enzyme required for sulfatase activity
MAHDVFISYSSRDRSVAYAACATMESNRIRCWIAPRDVLPGIPYAEALIEAINGSRIMVLIFSSGANTSPQVSREVERAVAKGLPIIPFRVEDVPPSAAMEYYISSPHWLDALTPPLEEHLHHLAETVSLLLSRSRQGGADAKPAAGATQEPGADERDKNGVSKPASDAYRNGDDVWERKLIVNGVEFLLVHIAPGAFMMGSPEGEGAGNEHPVHEIRITNGFWLGKYPVTQRQWKAVKAQNPAHFRLGDAHPVESVSWEEVQEYIKTLSSKGVGKLRIPTEAEWEYACRAGTEGPLSFGDDERRLGEYAWYCGNSDQTTHPVGKKRPNGWGVYDMLGNVWEWCADWFDPDYYRNSPPADPRGPNSGSSRVNRGGSWNSAADRVRSTCRGYNSPPRGNFLGFRLLSPA